VERNMGPERCYRERRRGGETAKEEILEIK
jgi:hypothetical protein